MNSFQSFVVLYFTKTLVLDSTRSWLFFTLKNPKEIPQALDRFYEWYVTLLFGGRGSSDFLLLVFDTFKGIKSRANILTRVHIKAYTEPSSSSSLFKATGGVRGRKNVFCQLADHVLSDDCTPPLAPQSA